MISFSGKSVSGRMIPPPSKSQTHRAFFLSALSSRECGIGNALDSDDTRSTLNAVRAIGADVSVTDDMTTIRNERIHAPEHTVDAGNSGTTMRLFTGIASMFGSPVTITGDASLRTRPMGPLLDALSEMNVKCSSHGGKAPVTIRGPNAGGTVHVRGSVSSQFISSLMIAAPMFGSDTEILIEGSILSRPYIKMTASVMERFGGSAEFQGDTVYVKGGTGYKGCDLTVPADMSSAAYLLAAGALGGCVTAGNTDMNDPQGDRKIVDILKEIGSDVTVTDSGVTASRGRLDAADVDMHDIPDLFPITAVLLSTAKGTSRLYGAPHLRFKESDRIDAVVNMLNALGADTTGTEDGCIIRGVKKLKGGYIEHRSDHRIMMSAAVASLVCEGSVSMEDSNCYDVSYPSFIDHMKRMGMNVRSA